MPLITAVIVTLVYAAIAVGRVPRLLLAGNFTLLGSAATLIVAEVARANGARLDFMAYLRAGVPITIVTLAFGVIWLEWVF